MWSCNTPGNPPVSGNADTINKGTAALPDEEYAVQPTEVLKDYGTWYHYTYYNVILSQDFIGLSADSVRIDKKTFLYQLMNEKVVAFKIKRLREKPVYRLYKTNDHLDAAIRSTAAQLASIEMNNFKREGMPLPAFSFTDLKGQTYTNTSTKSKVLVLKCWFIHCVACVREFPECNALVNAYQNRNDVLFLSLAIDKKSELESFLKNRELRYAVIPEMAPYMTKELHITSYPTHLLIDRTGKIIKVVNKLDELEPFLKKAVEKPGSNK